MLHVRDISHPETREQAADVEDILADLGLSEDVPVLELWNKIDLLPDATRAEVVGRANRAEGVLPISAVTGEGLPSLLEDVAALLEGQRVTERVTLDYGDGQRRAWLFQNATVESETQGAAGAELIVTWSPEVRARFARRFPDDSEPELPPDED